MTTHCALSFSLRPEAKTGSTTRLKVNKRNATNISAKMAVFFLPLYFRKSASSSMAHNCRRSSGILVFSLKPFPPRKKTNINISSLVEFQRWWVLKSKIFAMWWAGFKNFISFFEMEEHGASEAHKNEFLNYEVLKI